MIKAASLFTQEIDDMNLACRQLKAQLDSKLTLMSSTVGIVQCSPDFIESGIMENLYRELNIPLVGGTTAALAANNAVSSLMFSVLVLTSDDVEFAVSYTSGFENDYKDAINRSLKEAMAKPRMFPQAPLKLVLVFPSIIDAIAGDSYVEAIESVCGKTPVFGTLSVDDSLDLFDKSASVCNGSFFRYEMTYVLLFGNVNPRFSVTKVPAQTNLVESNAIITKASGNIAYEINNMRAIDYFENIGLASAGKFKDGVIFIPLLMTLPDSTDDIPFVRALIRADPDGSAVFRGKIIEGAHFMIGSNVGSDVISSTSDSVARIAREKDVSAAIFFSCIVRQLVIGTDSMRELTQIKDAIPSDIPFIASYAGGEIAPTSVDCENNAQNRFHNYSFITCLL